MDKIRTVDITITNSSEAVWFYRKSKGFETQKELAEYIELPKWVVSAWETGRPTPKYPVPVYIWRGHSFVWTVPITDAMEFERWRRGITMEELGALLGVSKQSINAWEQCQWGWESLARSWGFSV